MRVIIRGYLKVASRLTALRNQLSYLVNRSNAAQLAVMIVLCSPSSLSAVTATEWQGIRPLHSARRDVERRLGTPSRSGKYLSHYELTSEFVEIMYAQGPPCGNTLVDMWQVPKDTVINIRIVPKQRLTLSTAVTGNLDLKRSDANETGVAFYINEQIGVRYTVQVDKESNRELIVSIDYLPRQGDYHLKCATAQKVSSSGFNVPVFEKYGRVSSLTERAILDNFAIQLFRHDDLTGYIIVRSGNRNSRTTGRHLRFIKTYLSKTRAVPSSRFFVLGGQSNGQFTVELYLVSKDKPIPTPD